MDLHNHAQRARHLVERFRADRVNSNCSRFCRNPLQLAALVRGPVIEHISGGDGRELRIVVLGCSYGPEPVSIASMLLSERPDIDFRIDAYDIDVENLRFARLGRYDESRHVRNHFGVTDSFVDFTFDRIGGELVVKPEIGEHIRYAYADASARNLFDVVGPADIVFAQHFLYHLQRRVARKALRRIVNLLPRSGVLFLDGVDLDIKERCAKKCGLVPLDWKIKEIHECSRRTRWADAWPYSYYGLEPLYEHGDWRRRYATVYLRSVRQ